MRGAFGGICTHGAHGCVRVRAYTILVTGFTGYKLPRKDTGQVGAM